jgi:SseB protein N-terminal domain
MTTEANSDPAGRGFPEIVLAPARRDVRPGRDSDVIFEVRELPGGRRVMPVFTTAMRLVAALGPHQPWVALPLRNIAAIMGGAGVHSVVLDPRADSGAWRWQASDLRALERMR